ncbi:MULTISPECIES: hypothetical protein [Mycobacterium]|uniref:hypothetical protein n=1 Tax=Mycobacterium TaxID=1763 RepID=UPI0002AD0481|nr:MULTISPECIES: hypothetical protein [Mycobacterium]ELR85688.1 hypothetical protein W7U_10730 [Mycobacterium sp. H4Y]
MTETDTATVQPDADDQTDQDATDQPVDDAATTDVTAASGDDSDADEDHGPNTEAARYRKRLREVEAERDGLAERLAGYQRSECEAAVADLLDVPTDIWDVGQADPALFYSDDGTLNDAELRAAAGAIVDQRPRLAKQTEPSRSPNWGQVSAGHAPPGSGGPSWGDIINPR